MQTFHLKRFFAQFPQPIESFPADLTVSDTFVVHHLGTVIRAKVGESVVMVDARRQTAYVAKIQSLQKQAVQLQVQGRLPAMPATLPKVTVAAALVKEQRWDWLLQKTTELGAFQFQPILAERSVIKLSDKDFPKKVERWESIVRAAAEQSEGLFIPDVLSPLPVANLVSHPDFASHQKILLAERGDQRMPLKSVLSQLDGDQPILIALGPEGGWTDGELEQFAAAKFAFASLGQRILRSETIAAAAMAAVAYEFDR